MGGNISNPTGILPVIKTGELEGLSEIQITSHFPDEKTKDKKTQEVTYYQGNKCQGHSNSVF